MKIDLTGGGFRMKRGMFFSGLLIEIFVPIIAIPLFLIGEEIEKALSLPESYTGAFFVVVFIFIGAGSLIGILLLFGSFLIPLFSMIGSNNRLLAEGVPAEAKILAVADTGTRINQNPLVSFTLEVRPGTDQPFQASVNQTVSVIHLPSYQPGKLVNVKYIPGTNEVAIVGVRS